nr:12264_t:CDS:2 [Entrophospora candida]
MENFAAIPKKILNITSQDKIALEDVKCPNKTNNINLHNNVNTQGKQNDPETRIPLGIIISKNHNNRKGSNESNKIKNISKNNKRKISALDDNSSGISLLTHIDTPYKPPYTYASLIGQAILTSPDKKMKLNEIYAWIMTTYPFYKVENKGWQNSIRHNLSLYNVFVKELDNSKSSKKDCYWTIPSEYQCAFVDGVYRHDRIPNTSKRTKRSEPESNKDYDFASSGIHIHQNNPDEDTSLIVSSNNLTTAAQSLLFDINQVSTPLPYKQIAQESSIDDILLHQNYNIITNEDPAFTTTTNNIVTNPFPVINQEQILSAQQDQQNKTYISDLFLHQNYTDGSASASSNNIIVNMLQNPFLVDQEPAQQEAQESACISQSEDNNNDTPPIEDNIESLIGSLFEGFNDEVSTTTDNVDTGDWRSIYAIISSLPNTER